MQLAKKVGRKIWERYRIPVYFYEAAAQSAERTNLEDIRKGQFEGLRDAGAGSRLIADGRTLRNLRARGRSAAEAWLARHGSAIGRNATVDLVAEVLGAA